MEKKAAAEISDYLDYYIHGCDDKNQNPGNFRVNKVGSESNF